MRTLVVGGGIGGLAAAIALAGSGHDVTVVEKMSGFTPVGAGIVMAPNAVRTLAALGIDLTEHGRELPSLDVVRADGTLTQRIDTQRLSGRYGPAVALSRPELHAALLAHLPPTVHLLGGSAVVAVRQVIDGVEVRLAGEESPRRFEVVVGADGIHSTVRELAVGAQTLRYSGVTCWRGLTVDPGFGRAVESWGAGTRIGVVPLRHGRLYYYLVASAPRRTPQPTWPEGFRRLFGSHGGNLAALFDVLTEAPPLHHDIEELDTPVWGRGRVLLLGDAAHAMTPNQGQGAAMAIEDAYALMLALRPGIEGADRRYAATRHRRVRKMQLTSRWIGTISHWSSPVARSVRDNALRILPEKAADAQYHRLVRPALDLLDAT